MKTKTILKRKLLTLSLLCVSILVFMLFAMITPVAVQAHAYTPATALSQMTADDSIDFIVQNDIEVPDGWLDEPGFGDFVQSIIQAVETDPDISFTFSYNKTVEFVESVKTLVNEYNGISKSSQSSTQSTQTSTQSSSSLLYNEIAGPWQSDFPYYNCYAYAIGETQLPPNYPSWHYQHQPGDFAGTGSFGSTTTILQLANVVKDDLIWLGYYASVTRSQPAVLQANQTLIAIRRAWWDYHFMRYNSEDGYWYHKPGGTTILRYLHHPDTMNWVHEGWSPSGYFNTGRVYDSDVYYITFSTSPISGTANASVISGTSNAQITGVSGSLSGNVKILSPVAINGVVYPLTTIGASALANQSSCAEILLSSSITSIGNSAFANCTGLQSIVIPSTVTTMGTNVFSGCSNITIYTVAKSKPSGWQSSWAANRPVFWGERKQYQSDVITGFGYTGSTYYWNGALRLTVPHEINTYNNSSGMLVIDGANSALTFNVRTVSSSNAFTSMSGYVRVSHTPPGGSATQVLDCNLSVNIVNNVTLSPSSFTLNTSNLANGVHTLTLTSYVKRGSWDSSSTKTYTFEINKKKANYDNLMEFGYNGSTFYWNGAVDMTVTNRSVYSHNSSTNTGTITGATDLSFSIRTISSSNSISVISGDITFKSQTHEYFIADSSGSAAQDRISKSRTQHHKGNSGHLRPYDTIAEQRRTS